MSEQVVDECDRCCHTSSKSNIAQCQLRKNQGRSGHATEKGKLLICGTTRKGNSVPKLVPLVQADLRSSDVGRDGIRWEWQQDFNIGCTAALLELTTGFDHVLSATSAVLLHKAFHPDQGLHILAKPICPVSHHGCGQVEFVSCHNACTVVFHDLGLAIRNSAYTAVDHLQQQTEFQLVYRLCSAFSHLEHSPCYDEHMQPECWHSHEVKSTIRRDEGDGAVIIESCQPDALMELHVF